MEPTRTRIQQGPVPTAGLEPPIQERAHHIDRTITELSARLSALQMSITPRDQETPSTISARLVSAQQILTLPSTVVDRATITTVAQHAIDTIQEELTRLQGERNRLIFPLGDLSPEMLGIVVQKADQETRSHLAGTTRHLRDISLFTTKIECEAFVTELLMHLQQELPKQATHNPPITKQVVQALSQINANEVRTAPTFTEVQEVLKDIRFLLAQFLVQLAQEDIEAAESIMRNFLSDSKYQQNAAKNIYMFVRDMLEVGKIPTYHERYDACERLAEQLIKKGDIDEALLLPETFEAKGLGLYRFKSELLGKITAAIGKNGDFERALRLSHDNTILMEDEDKEDIAALILDRMDPIRGFSLLDQHSGGAARPGWFGKMALVIAKRGNVGGAIDFITKIQDPVERDLVCSGCAMSMTARDNYDQALLVTEKMRDARYKDPIFGFLAKRMFETDKARAIELANRIQDPIEKAFTFEDFEGDTE